MEIQSNMVQKYNVSSGKLDVNFRSTSDNPKKEVPKTPQKEVVFTEKEVKDSVDRLNKELDKSGNNTVQFQFEKKLGIMVVNTVDTLTGEIIGSMPPKDIVQAKIQQFDFIGSLLNIKG